MDFNHSADRQMLADTLQRFLADRYGFETRQKIAASDAGYSAETWAALAELGVIGALFDEAAGGFGGSGWDVMVVFEAIGRNLVVEPFLGALMAGRALALSGGQDERIAAIVSGETVAAFAHYEPHGRYDPAAIHTSARREGEGWRIDGRKAVVVQAEAADLLVVSARADGLTALFAVDKGASGLAVRSYRTTDGGHAGELTLADTPAALVAENADAIIERVVGAGIVALTAESLGAMEAARDATLAYLQTRVQFGTVIGKFQALQHRMADLLIEVEQARSAVINAAAALDGDDRTTRERALSAAKYTIGRVGTLVAEEAIQMHGGIGMTWELPLAHYAKRLVMIDHQLGDEDYHLARYIELGRAA